MVIFKAPVVVFRERQTPGTHSIGERVSPSADMEAVENRQSVASAGIEPRFLGHPAHSLVIPAPRIRDITN
jgi:hypothetical protein